ncbi:MAG: Eco57I restriction-modification methylase domain-containing protein [Desulfovibrionaceae bacterium]
MEFSQDQRQRPLPGAAPSPAPTAATTLVAHEGVEARGAVFTRPEVVGFILDLVGYTVERPLHKMRLLEPAFGGGSFLLPCVRRLLHAWRKAGGRGEVQRILGEAILAVELHQTTFYSTRAAVMALLQHEGITPSDASVLADRWLRHGDYLLTDIENSFDFVVGNPPYVRQELIPSALLDEYRRRYKTIYDRADIYVPFMERSLSMLSKSGCLGFICPDRWMKNRYGGPLRDLVDKHFHLKFYVDMTDTPAFHANVIAYPAITVICREKAGSTRIAHRPMIDRPTLSTLAQAMRQPVAAAPVRTLTRATNGSEPWLLGSADQMALIRRLEKCYPSLEQAKCKVGIGVATGADRAFIGSFASLDVEPDRKLPLATTKDIASGRVRWRGLGVINPFAMDGGLVDLHRYPRLKRYLEARREIIAKRHCAQRTPANWYRTIDRITPTLAHKPKLLIPDIKDEANVVYEPGELYPHHNLYFVTSAEWDLRALQAVLLSEVSRLFVATYSTKMRGGFLRFQAQYLRRIRLPFWASVPDELRGELAEAAVRHDLQACNRAALKLFELTPDEIDALRGDGD